MHSIGISLHGVLLNLESDHQPLIEYATEHLNRLAGEPHASPDLMVRCFWAQEEWNERSNPFESDGSLQIIGKRMLGNENELIWLNTLRMKGLKLRFVQQADRYLFEVYYVFHPNKEKMAILPQYEYRKYFSLMQYLVYFPAAWLLERRHGMTLMHASALTIEHGSIVIAGPGGVGKTTTCVALLQQEGTELIAENLIFTDGRFVYPCYEPIRLNDDSLEMLGDQLRGMTRMVFPEGVREKSLFHFHMSDRVQRTSPLAIFLPRFSTTRYVRRISPEIAAERIVAMNRLALEVDDYGWYAAALDMQWPAPETSLKLFNTLRSLASNVPCFELGIDRKAGIKAVVEDILGNA